MGRCEKPAKAARVLSFFTRLELRRRSRSAWSLPDTLSFERRESGGRGSGYCNISGANKRKTWG